MRRTINVIFLVSVILLIIFVIFVFIGARYGWIDGNTLYISIATVLSGACTLILGSVSIYNEHSAVEEKKEYELEKERNAVRPFLQFAISYEEGKYILKIYNYSNNIAANVFVFNYCLTQMINGNDSYSKILSNSFWDDYSLDEVYMDYYPINVDLFYYDKNNRMIHQVFRLREEDLVYESDSEDIEYITA